MRIAALLVCLLASMAHAEDPESAALQRIDRGVGAFRAGDYTAARREFEAARRLVPSRANAYRWLGLTDVKLGDCAAAIVDFDMFLKLVPANDERVAEVIRFREQCLAGAAPPTTTPPSPSPSLLATAPAPPRTPVYRRWWLWTVVGGAAALAGAGIAIGVVFGQPHEARLGPVICVPAGCAAGAM